MFNSLLYIIIITSFFVYEKANIISLFSSEFSRSLLGVNQGVNDSL